ncbi:4'-phosphopantetheinyl transferase superfamily protein [Streptomyces tubbatahanensis]|uniref:4'-phosphopantetheinyl transferase superfamily protein n=1 Tax=Streptomyces tubbatahanensis TaxID=2923272 RepID=A0ABY3XXX0_9ACTN|nr:4'-phosphopantetheinyl transferase superfamily protein [Streptomyces tubbatahanensis]UNS99083.1 4'-phosphopantetheinyl transferase superfamily protein [Streptomyces tubbatahanensis]
MLGVGLDIADLHRMARLLARFGDRELRSVFTRRELTAVRGADDPALRLGISFGAKEACGKALGTGLVGVAWTDIEATPEPGPDGTGLHVELTGAAGRRAHALGMSDWPGCWRAAADGGRVLVVLAAVSTVRSGTAHRDLGVRALLEQQLNRGELDRRKPSRRGTEPS